MRRFSILFRSLILLFSVVNLTFAQDDTPNRRELLDAIFDADSFGSNVRFMGLGQTSVVFLRASCVPHPGGPNDRCVVLNPAPALTEFDIQDIGRITFPGNSAKNIIYFLQTNNWNYQFLNTTGAPQGNAHFLYEPYWTVESDALNDPRAINAITGLPLNGKFEPGAVGQRMVSRSLAVNERARESLNSTRAGISGLSKSFFEQFIPSDIVDRMFRGPITIRFNLAGRARLVSDGTLSYSVRFMGN